MDRFEFLSSALWARGLYPGCSAPDPWVAFFACAKKATKGLSQPRIPARDRHSCILYIKSTPPDAALLLRSAALGPARSHATPVAGERRARPERDPCGAQSQSLSVLRRGIGGGKGKFDSHPCLMSLLLTFNPLGSSRANRADDVGPGGASEGSRACASATGMSRMRTPGGQRRTREPRAALLRGAPTPGGAFLSFISLRAQRNGPQGAGGGAPASSRSDGAHGAHNIFFGDRGY